MGQINTAVDKAINTVSDKISLGESPVKITEIIKSSFMPDIDCVKVILKNSGMSDDQISTMIDGEMPDSLRRSLEGPKLEAEESLKLAEKDLNDLKKPDKFISKEEEESFDKQKEFLKSQLAESKKNLKKVENEVDKKIADIKSQLSKNKLDQDKAKIIEEIRQKKKGIIAACKSIESSLSALIVSAKDLATTAANAAPALAESTAPPKPTPVTARLAIKTLGSAAKSVIVSASPLLVALGGLRSLEGLIDESKVPRVVEAIESVSTTVTTVVSIATPVYTICNKL